MSDLPPPPDPSYRPPGAPPPGPGPSSPPPPGYGQPGVGPYGPYGRPPGSTTNPLAITSMVLAGVGILAVLFCIGPLVWVVGLVLGVVALSQIKRTGQGGRGLAIGGIVANAVLLAIAVLVFVLFVVLASTTAEYCDRDDDGDGILNCADPDPDGFGIETTTTFSIPR